MPAPSGWRLNEVDNVKLHSAYIGLGSNVEPEANLAGAIQALRLQLTILCLSSVWRSPSLGAPGPDFLNAVAKIETELDGKTLRQDLLRPIERSLGRVRGSDKFAPRTIDLDLLIFDGQILDEHIWDYPHLAVPLAECEPGIISPDGKRLVEIASRLQSSAEIFRIALAP